MEKIYTQSRMSKIELDSMFFEIIICKKGDGFRARCSSMSKIPNIRDFRPEATSQISYENAIQKLIPKIENALCGTNKRLGRIFQNENGKILYSLENVIYKKQNMPSTTNVSTEVISSLITTVFKNMISTSSIDSNPLQQLTTMLSNIMITSNADTQIDTFCSQKIIKFQNVIVEWQQELHERTKKDYEDDNYFSPTTLESYSRNLRSYVFPYLENHPEYDNIKIVNEDIINEIFNTVNCDETKRILLISLKLIFEFAIQKNYITINPISNKKFKSKKKNKKKRNSDCDYDFIEEEQRPLFINCMLKEIATPYNKDTDAPLAFLFNLLHGCRPEETCGVRWMDLDFEDNDYHVQNAHKSNPVYDEVTMERISWKYEDGPLKTPESYRHISLDLLVKPLLIQHKKKQKDNFKKVGKKWTEKEYVFLNSTGTPFVPKVLSRNFTKFIKRNNLPHIVLYGLRHSFATHCRNLGMEAEVLAMLMGHTEYETTQKYYIHISSKQKKDQLQKVQHQDLQIYLSNENKDLTHLQNNISKYNKNVSNLHEVQNEDILQYQQVSDDTLSILKNFMLQVNTQNKTVA